MKASRYTVLLLVFFGLYSCKTLNNVLGPKSGCPTNGKNIGAEKLVSGDPDAEKAARKARKFRS